MSSTPLWPTFRVTGWMKCGASGRTFTMTIDLSIWGPREHGNLTFNLIPFWYFFSNYRTPFHADVFRSYSWSTNVCGCKEWLLYPPGQEAYLYDSLGNLPFDVTSTDLEDSRRYPNASKACRPIRVIQNAGETIFVPRFYYHNLTQYY